MTMESTLGFEPDRADIARDAAEATDEILDTLDVEAFALDDDEVRRPCFEVVHTGTAKWHARFVALNGEVVWTTESYKRRREAIAAIALLNARLHPTRHVDETE